MSFRARVAAFLGWEWDSGAKDSGRLQFSLDLTEGTGDDEAEAIWHGEDQVILSGGSTTLDLTALTRTVLGDTLTTTLMTVRAVLIENQNTDLAYLAVGGAAADEWSEPFSADGDKVKVMPGSPLFLACLHDGWTVDNSNKNLKLAAVGGDVTYSIAILGTITYGDSDSSSA